MPTRKAAKKSSKKSAKRASVAKPVEEKIEDVMTFEEETKAPAFSHSSTSTEWYASKTLWGIIVVGVVLVGVLAFRRGMLVVATVNGSPIFRWNLDSALMSRYGKQTLEGMISESLIADAAKKANVTVSKEELAAKETEIVKNLGGTTSIDDLLKFQGVSKEDFTKQLTTQLMVQKILSKDVIITDEDVDNFIATASGTLTATEPAALKDEARKAIVDAKVGEKVQEWFTKLKDTAKITKYVE